jgi:hypothetical protein
MDYRIYCTIYQFSYIVILFLFSVRSKFSVEETQSRFLDNYKAYGFKDKSSMLRAAINHLKKEFELQRLKESADLYSEIYSEDEDLKELTETAAAGWPE